MLSLLQTLLFLLQNTIISTLFTIFFKLALERGKLALQQGKPAFNVARVHGLLYRQVLAVKENFLFEGESSSLSSVSFAAVSLFQSSCLSEVSSGRRRKLLLPNKKSQPLNIEEKTLTLFVWQKQKESAAQY
jgi:hypothetical protein